MRTSLKIDTAALFLPALLILTLPMKWLFAAFSAAAFHELCHIFVTKLFGGKIYSIQIGSGGAKIRTSALSNLSELLCAMAGPAGSLFLVGLHRILPRVAICGLVQGLFNLLPLFPMDGGRILKCASEILLPPDWADTLYRITETATIVTILLLSVYGMLRYDLGLLIPMAAAIVLFKSVSRKIPCKESNLRVQ